MPDHLATPAAKRFDPDDLDTPVAVSALDAMDEYLSERSGAGLHNVVLAKQRIAALHAYLRLFEDELDIAAVQAACECSSCCAARAQAVPS